MQKVVIINLNGRAYQLDEGAYESLRAYLGRAEAALAKNPDKTEIIADLEQAIAEKCDRFLGPAKNVVTLAEINEVMEEMGPVHDSTAENAARPDAAAEADDDTSRPESEAPRRLYRVREGALIAGVCNGLAAYLNVDVTVVRLIFVLLTVVSSGIVALGYIVLMFVVPEANTSEEQAAARGMPFNAQEVIDRVKQSTKFGTGGNPWFGGWDTGHAARRRAERRAHRERLRARRYATYGERQVDYAGQVLAGIFVPIASIISAALFVAAVLAIISLVMSGTIFGWVSLVPMPLWAQILILVLAYHLVAWPLHVISHAPLQRDGTGGGWIAMWGGILWLGFAAVFLYFAYQVVPGFREFIDNFPESLSQGLNQGLRVTLKLLE